MLQHMIVGHQDSFLFFLFKKNCHLMIVLLILERKGGGGKIEKNIDRLPPVCTPTGDGTHNLGMCPDPELNPQPFGVWMTLQPTEPPGQGKIAFYGCHTCSVVRISF